MEYVSSICSNNEQSTLFALEIPINTDGEAIAEDLNIINNNDKTEEDKNIGRCRTFKICN